ncbi:MAG: response regulator, partial [Lachnospiraceae bacterium]|nr:response regulator [Lachnospiraceae bacterium]
VDTLSNMAYNKYLVYKSNVELERSGNMKSDFLANMSHEIRTPMNAVIGMAEMALREELPSAARDYIMQIKEAGRSLLTIINDILDFSKIESGKMDIVEEEYEPMSIVYDVANIIMTRLRDKDVELILDIDPSLPNKLLGDSIRIKQVLLNLANNAAKFTPQGKIVIKMDNEEMADGRIQLQISVEDTGIGIKEEDVGKLFQSFQQVDSKRNRKIEGTGLGLAISKRLLDLMEGDIQLETEYGKGSRFSFVLPQKVVDRTLSISVQEPEKILIAGLISNPYVRENLYSDAAALGIDSVRLSSARDLLSFSSERRLVLFIEYPMFTQAVEGFVLQNPDITAVLLINFDDHVNLEIPNLLIMKKPLFILNIATILNGKELYFSEDMQEKEYDFIAPEAHVLIVDDNAVNLTVAEGLLEPLKMNIDTAISGKEAIEKTASFHYDIVFMDHMMPELDGVETTHIIRRFHSEYNDVPIIALTANAVEGTKEMFCREGMNDFVAKPIEIRMLVAKVKQWLPAEKIQRVYDNRIFEKKEKDDTSIIVGDLDVKSAINLLVSEELFWKVLTVFFHGIDKKAKLIQTLVEQENWIDYTVEVHALKNAAKQIGAMSLSEKAAALEIAGNARDLETIYRDTDAMITQYLDYLPVLEPFCAEEEEDEEGKEEISEAVLLECFQDMEGALDDLDMDRMEEAIKKMGHYHYEGWQHEMFDELKEAVEEVDVELCETILEKWKTKTEM